MEQIRLVGNIVFVQNNWYIYIGLVYDQHINIFGGPVPGISEIMFAEYTTATAPVSNVCAVGSTRGVGDSNV